MAKKKKKKLEEPKKRMRRRGLSIGPGTRTYKTY